jgi:glyceraldehyde 3-phosphate dehydrogenase
MGVNDDEYDPEAPHRLERLVHHQLPRPGRQGLLDNFGIEHGLMTTVHSYTNDQHILDLPHRKGDLRRARAAAVNMIPSSTGAAKALAEVIPALKGKFDGQAIRVPTWTSPRRPHVRTEKPHQGRDPRRDEEGRRARGPMKGVLDYTEEQLVSSDYIGNPASSIVRRDDDPGLGDNFAKIFAWYDNEWGFSNRMIDLALMAAKKG